MEKNRITICLTMMFLFCALTLAEEPKVIIYTFTQNGTEFGLSKSLREYLIKSDIPFETIDILKPGNENVRKEIGRKTGQGGVPVFDINGEIVVGSTPPKRAMLNSLIEKYFPRVVLTANTAKLTMILAGSQRYVNSDKANSILEKCFNAYKARLIYQLCLTSELTKAAEKSSLPSQKMAVMTVAKDAAFNDYKSALAEFRRICNNNPTVREARFAWDKAANESDSVNLQWAGLFGSNIIQDQSAFQVKAMQQENAESFAAIRTESERILGAFKALFPTEAEQQSIVEYSYWALQPNPKYPIDGPGVAYYFKIRRGYNRATLQSLIDANLWIKQCDWYQISEQMYLGITEREKKERAKMKAAGYHSVYEDKRLEQEKTLEQIAETAEKEIGKSIERETTNPILSKVD